MRPTAFLRSGPLYSQICSDIDAYDIHQSWWNPADYIHPHCSYIFHGPPGVGKYAHAIHFLREKSQSRFAHGIKPPLYIEIEIPGVSHCSSNPPQSFSFLTSDVHIEIDLEQLGTEPLIVWDAVFQQALPLFPFFLCLHVDKAPDELLRRLYTYMLPFWPSGKVARFLFLTEQCVAIPQSLLQMNVRRVSFPRPSEAQYRQCVRIMTPAIPFPVERATDHEPNEQKKQKDQKEQMVKGNPDKRKSTKKEKEKNEETKTEVEVVPDDVVDIWDLYYQHAYNKKGGEIEDPFGSLCEKMVECIQSIFAEDAAIAFSIEDVRSILNEWAVHHICYEEGLWYVLGRCIVLAYVTGAQVPGLFHKWGDSGPYFESPGMYNYKRAEYMCAELIEAVLKTKTSFATASARKIKE